VWKMLSIFVCVLLNVNSNILFMFLLFWNLFFFFFYFFFYSVLLRAFDMEIDRLLGTLLRQRCLMSKFMETGVDSVLCVIYTFSGGGITQEGGTEDADSGTIRIVQSSKLYSLKDLIGNIHKLLTHITNKSPVVRLRVFRFLAYGLAVAKWKIKSRGNMKYVCGYIYFFFLFFFFIFYYYNA
jgi:hypothetical protein